MADASINQVMLDAAQHLGDPNQNQFTPSVLTPYFGQAFREIYSIFEGRRLPTGQRIAYAYLPAFTNQMSLSQAGIADIGRPTRMWERTINLSESVTGVTNATPMVVTVSGPSQFASNSLADVTGVTGPIGVNDEWYVSVSGSDLTLNGSVAGGSYIGGGQVIQSQDYWHLMQESDPLPQWVAGTYNYYWRYMNQRFYFIGAVNAVELKIEYSSSGDPPTSGNVGLDNCQNYLGYRIAGLAASDYDMPNKAAKMNFEAFGPSGQPDGTGGALYWMLNPLLLEKQNRRLVPGTFRPRRNNPWQGWW